MTDPFAITEEPIPLPDSVYASDPESAYRQLLIRCGSLARHAESDQRESFQHQRDFLVSLLEVADVLDRLLQRPYQSLDSEDSDLARLHRSLAATRRLLAQKLERAGVTRIALVGQPLDPAIADVEGYREHADLPEETVLYEIQSGYQWHEHLLRRARVLVSHAS